MFGLPSLFANPLFGAAAIIFWLWMLIDAVQRSEWTWVIFMFLFPLTPVFYFFMVYRGAASATQGFELPGASRFWGRRQRINELEALIHNLDKAHHHLELGNIYFQKGNLAKAESYYRASLERDPQDIDARAHLGQCLLRQKRAGEARPILEQVCTENPKHEYGHSLMALAETLGALGEEDRALGVWRQVLQDHGYARAKTQLGQIYLSKRQKALADVEFREVINDDRHAPAFQRRRDRVWVRKAKRLLRATP